MAGQRTQWKLTQNGLKTVVERFRTELSGDYDQLEIAIRACLNKTDNDNENYPKELSVRRFFQIAEDRQWIRFDNANKILKGLWKDSPDDLPQLQTLALQVDKGGNPIHDIEQIASAFKWSKEVENPLLQSPYVADEFKGIIQDKTQDFVGRGYVQDAFTEFVTSNTSGYFVLKGEPGEGKSTIVAEFCKKQPCLLYFNSFAHAFVRSDQFLKSICLQLIEHFQFKEYVDVAKWPEDAVNNGGFLLKLLHRASDKLSRDQKLVIFVDALDEYALEQQPLGNILYLPDGLPDKVYFFLTYRRENEDSKNIEERFRTSTNPKKHNLADFPGSYTDIGLYIRKLLARPTYQDPISAWLRHRSKSEDQLIDELTTLSDRNFMFISYVMKELSDPKGLYAEQGFDALPTGLKNYYNSHWARMRPDEAGCRILAQVCVSSGPLTVEEIAIRSGQKKYDVLMILQKWTQFFPHYTSQNGGERYRLYHSSYRDYLFKERSEIKLFIGDERDANDDAVDNML